MRRVAVIGSALAGALLGLDPADPADVILLQAAAALPAHTAEIDRCTPLRRLVVRLKFLRAMLRSTHWVTRMSVVPGTGSMPAAAA